MITEMGKTPSDIAFDYPRSYLDTDDTRTTKGKSELKENIFETEARSTTVNIVITKIKDLLIERKLRPGDMLPSESVLAESLKVGRSSIREALKILSAFGVIEIKRGDGTYISSASNKKIFNPYLFQLLVQESDYDSLLQVRELLEEGIVHMVIKTATDEEIAQLNEALEEFYAEVKKEDPVNSKANEYDIRYHRMMGKFSHNPIIENIYSFVIDLFTPTINPHNTGVLESHAGIQKAIAERDEVTAKHFIHAHTKAWMATHVVMS